MDFSNLSDEELLKIAQGEQPAQDQAPGQLDFAGMSDDELEKLAQGEDDSDSFLENLGSSALEGIIYVGEKIDQYGGAPSRAGVKAIMDGANPITAFGSQFGEDPSEAPTGAALAKDMGFSDQPLPYGGSYKGMAMQDVQPLPDENPNPSSAGVVGLGIDIVADPLNLVGLAPAKALKFGKNATKAGVSTAKQGAKALPGVEATGNILKSSASATSEALSRMFKPSQAPDFDSMKVIAKKHGIDPEDLPEAIEFGEDSFISRAARHRAEGVVGEPYLKKFNETYEKIQDATEKQIAKLSGGSVPDPVEAGQLIREGFDKGVDDFFNNIEMTHNKVIKAIPQLTLSPESFAKIESKLNGLEKWAKGRISRGFTNAQRAQAQQVLRAVQAARRSNQSYKQTVETLRDIGEIAFKSENILADVPPDIRKFRDLYFTIDEALIDTVEKSAGRPVADSLRLSNEKITKFLGEKSAVAKAIGNKNIAPEKVFRLLIENGDTRKINALKEILPPETFKQLKGAFLASQIKKNADEIFSFKTYHNSLRNKRNVVGALLDPNEIDSISELISLGSRMGNPILSSSGTGASNVFSDIGKGIRSGLESDLVIGKMKQSARSRSAKALPKPQPKISASQAKATEKTLNNYKQLYRVSPVAARTLYLQDNSKKDTPIKGRSKWALDGFSHLLEHDKSGAFKDAKIVERIFKSEKGKQLLYKASDLKPNSKPMESISKKLKKEFEGGK